jgi:hypothetical protein
MIGSDRFMPHRLAEVVEVNPGGRSSILGEESAVDQTPEVDYAADDIRDLTNIDTGHYVIQFVACRLLRFVER